MISSTQTGQTSVLNYSLLCKSDLFILGVLLRVMMGGKDEECCFCEETAFQKVPFQGMKKCDQ